MAMKKNYCPIDLKLYVFFDNLSFFMAEIGEKLLWKNNETHYFVFNISLIAPTFNPFLPTPKFSLLLKSMGPSHKVLCWTTFLK